MPVTGGSKPIANGTLYEQYHLLEISLVSVPANVDCNISVIRSMDDPAASFVIDAIEALREDNDSLRRRLTEAEAHRAISQMWQTELSELRRRVENAEVAAKNLNHLDDDLRDRILQLERIPNYVGVWREGNTYAPGAMATHAGSVWYCHDATDKKP